MSNLSGKWEKELQGWPIRPLEAVLVQDVGITHDEVAAAVEYMYRVLLSVYLMGSGRGDENNDRLRILTEHFLDRANVLRLLDCQVVVSREGTVVADAGRRELTNPLYRFSPNGDSTDYSGQGIGGFSQLRANLVAGWYESK